jgi:hypothetical protein
LEDALEEWLLDGEGNTHMRIVGDVLIIETSDPDELR